MVLRSRSGTCIGMSKLCLEKMGLPELGWGRGMSRDEIHMENGDSPINWGRAKCVCRKWVWPNMVEKSYGQ